MVSIAIIGTAGRGKDMTNQHWEWMKDAALKEIQSCGYQAKDIELVSGGAAWADHLAVWLYMKGHCEDLTLHLPAPWDFNNITFQGPHKSCASAAGYYHCKFSDAIDEDSLLQIQQVLKGGAKYTEQPAKPGYAGMFARNALVAHADEMLALTFGEGHIPADGGTLDTWNKSASEFKLHIPIPHF